MNTTRKGFLNGLLAAGVAPTLVPSSVLGANAPSNKFTLGAIGIGARGHGDLVGFLGNPNVRVVALADCNQQRFKRALKTVSNFYGPKHGVRTTPEFRDICTAKDIDAVMVTTNLHWHPYITLCAIQNGKHVFQEKPVAPSAEEGRLIVEAAKKKGVVLQIGFNRRAEQNFRWAAELALNGELGEIKEVICSTVGNRHWAHLPEEPVPANIDWKRWCGPCAITPYHHKKLSIWPTELMSAYSPNGMFQCWGCHYLDLAQFGLRREDETPVSVEGFGTFPYPGSGLTDTAVSWDVTYTYKDGLRLHFVENDTNKFGLVHGFRFVGTKGWSQGEDRGFKTSIPNIAKTALKPGKMPKQLPYVKGGVIADFVETVRAGRRECVLTQPERAWHSDLVAQIGMHAIKRGHRLDFDCTTCRYTNDPDANALLATRPYLNGWSLNDVRV